MKRLLYFCPQSAGGLADYAHEQANAIALLGVEVTMLAPNGFKEGAAKSYVPIALSQGSYFQEGKIKRRATSKIASFLKLLAQYRYLSKIILDGKFSVVLMSSFAEYFAPFWAPALFRLSRRGVVFGAVVHDPVRDFVLGPRWWHERSVKAAYGFLREAFVHEKITLDTVFPMPDLLTTVIPHGPYHFPLPQENRAEIRSRLDLPESSWVALSFGHLRDGKNLDLVIEAMSEIPEMFVIVAGKEQSSRQKPMSYYQKIATDLGVYERCRWVHEYVPPNQVGALFLVSDLILLNYSGTFQSASGVLNVAVQYRKPCLASSGGGNLRSVVQKYRLGVFVEPDDHTALVKGLRLAFSKPINSRWNEYEMENSWEQNARIVCERLNLL